MSAGQLPPPGTVLRKYDRNGAVRCEAVVAENGQVVYRGVAYPSISAAARVAAGDIGLAARSCDGYAFFGLKNRDGGWTGIINPQPPPVRWDDLPPAPSLEIATFAVSASPPSPVLAAVEEASAALTAPSASDHGEHGRVDESGTPRDADCACRGGADEEACAAAGCGFCRVARMAMVAAEALYRESVEVEEVEPAPPALPSLAPGVAETVGSLMSEPGPAPVPNHSFIEASPSHEEALGMAESVVRAQTLPRSDEMNNGALSAPDPVEALLARWRRSGPDGVSNWRTIQAAWTTAADELAAALRARAPAPYTFAALGAELARARAKFPRNRRLLVALMEEVGELAKALLQRQPIDREALRVAAVAVRIFEEGDADLADVTDEEAQP